MDRPLIEKLLRPAAFAHPADNLELLETHISWIVLSGPFAYKIKKPVRFEFLDFSTTELRRHYCEEELRLNRRFAPELYVEVVPITLASGLPQLHGAGPPIDHAVRMRRIDRADLLDELARRGGLDAQVVRILGAELARLHDILPPAHPDPESDDPGTPAALRLAMAQNYRQLEQSQLTADDAARLAAIKTWWGTAYQSLLAELKARIGHDHVIDAHGDTHLGNVALVDGRARFFDCIEFNPAFRILDGIAELALMSMDMVARGHGTAGNQLVSDYLEYRGDYEGLRLLRLYQCYFAAVRAKVGLLATRAVDGQENEKSHGYRGGSWQHYLAIAASYRDPPRLFLAITHGVSGSGKSTVAALVCAGAGGIRLRSDVERKRLAGLAPEQRGNASLYTRSVSRRTFDRLLTLARGLLDAGCPVVVDATFLHRTVRERFQRLAEQGGYPFLILDCEVEPAELRRRLGERERSGRDASDAGIAVMEQQLQEREPLDAEERRNAIMAGNGAETIWPAVQARLDP